MRIGILADIHGHVQNLRTAVNRLSNERVDLLVVLGDIICDRSNATETVALLKECKAVGVWGNHELGLCVDPDDEIRELYTQPVMEFFNTLNSHFQRGSLLFSHTLPDQDASNPLSYYLGPRPQEEGALDGAFSRFPHRLIMVGHFHCWFAATPAGRIAWEGQEPIKLDSDERYFFTIHAVMSGWAAVVDDEEDVLLPIRL
jgi:hypothetical protein